MPNVSFVKGAVRYDNVLKSLELIRSDVEEKLSSASRILMKPDLLHINGCSLLDSSSVEAARAVLDFVEQFTNKRVTIAESHFVDENVFQNHNFLNLLHDYSVKFLDLGHDSHVSVKICNSSVGVSRAILESDFRISLAVLKRDAHAGILGSIPNIVLGSISSLGRDSFYNSRQLNAQMAELFKLLRPGLAVIDCFDAFETEKKVKFTSAIASSDGVAADSVAAKILKIKPAYLGKFSKRRIRVLQ